MYEPSPLRHEITADEEVDGFIFRPGFGYECIICGLLVFRLDLHIPNVNGFCTDYGSNIMSDPQQPSSQAVIRRGSWVNRANLAVSGPALPPGQHLAGSQPVARDFAPGLFQWENINRQ